MPIKAYRLSSVGKKRERRQMLLDSRIRVSPKDDEFSGPGSNRRRSQKDTRKEKKN
jgi:hypothetical protein